MKMTIGRWAFAVACLPLMIGSCSSEGKNAGRGDPRAVADEESKGAVGLSLQVGGGVAIDSATYTVTGPGGFSRSGTSDLRHSATLSLMIGGLPAGPGYSISVTAVSNDGLRCTGTASFAVIARAIATVALRLQCQEPDRTGQVRVGGAFNVCPRIDALATSVAEVYVGSRIALSATAHDLDAAPQPIRYQWSTTSGTITNPDSAHAELACTSAGDAVVTLAVTDGDCADTLSTTVTCTPSPLLEVHPTVETDPVSHAGDAADDPAVWVNPLDPAQSLIIGTDKTAGGGLAVYDLGGRQVQFVEAGALNNVDVRADFPLAGQNVALVTAGNRTDNSIAIYKIDPVTRLLTNVAARTVTTLATYGSCMYRSAVTGKFYYFVDSKAGDIEQWELFDNGAGLVDAAKVRSLPKLGSQPEACVVDDELGVFYIGEEDVGIWKFAAEPTASGPGTLVDATGPGGHLVADVEGLAIARTGAGTGFLLAANQGDSTYAVYEREGSNAFVKHFSVTTGSSCIDGVTGSDGIDVTTASLGPAFPNGVFVTQDDTNDVGNQNFKLVPWQDIVNGPAAGSGNTASCSVDAGAPAFDAAPPPASDASPLEASVPSPADAGADAAGFPADFCAAFCGKCAGCWAPTSGFSEGDCLYKLSKPNFALDDCLAGCAVGKTPGFSPGILAPGWQELSCTAFDEGM